MKFCSPKNSWQACCYGAVSPGTCLAFFSIRYFDNNELKTRSSYKVQSGEIRIVRWSSVTLLYFNLHLEFLFVIPWILGLTDDNTASPNWARCHRRHCWLDGKPRKVSEQRYTLDSLIQGCFSEILVTVSCLKPSGFYLVVPFYLDNARESFGVRVIKLKDLITSV